VLDRPPAEIHEEDFHENDKDSFPSSRAALYHELRAAVAGDSFPHTNWTVGNITLDGTGFVIIKGQVVHMSRQVFMIPPQ
jgi:hypothetical protein